MHSEDEGAGMTIPERDIRNKIRTTPYDCGASMYDGNSAPVVDISESEITIDLKLKIRFYGVDFDSDKIRYEVQIDKVNTFDSAALVELVSGTDDVFTGVEAPATDDLFDSGHAVDVEIPIT